MFQAGMIAVVLIIHVLGIDLILIIVEIMDILIPTLVTLPMKHVVYVGVA